MGAVAIKSLDELGDKLTPPRIAWIMLPAGNPVDDHISILSNILTAGDIIIDGGNSHYKDDVRRVEALQEHGIEYLDVGVSGGIWGLDLGYCTMVGGKREYFKHIEPIIKTLAPNNGYLYCGPSGAGHYVKMIHNGIEYAMMEAYGEGFELLKASPFGKDLNLEEIAYLWNQAVWYDLGYLSYLKVLSPKIPTYQMSKAMLRTPARKMDCGGGYRTECSGYLVCLLAL